MRNAPYTFNFGCGNVNSSSLGACTGVYAHPLDPLGGTAGGGGYFLDGSMPVPVIDMTLATDPAKYIGTTILGTDFNYRNPYLQQFSLNVEKDFGGNVVTIAYVGNRGDRLVRNGVNVNQPPFVGAAYPFPNLTNVQIQLRATVLNSNYNALQTSLQRRLHNGLAANVNYTWAHNLTNAQVIDEGQAVGNCVGPCHVDNGSGQAVVYNSYYQYDYGNADLDTRHRLALTMTYDMRFGRSLRGPIGFVVKGWSVNSIYYAQTGNPFTVQNSGGLSQNKTIGVGNDRPNEVAISQPGFHKSINEWFNVTKFRYQAPGLLGNEMRNQIYGPGTQALGFSIFKSFAIHEDAKLQFRAELFNLLNTPTFNNPNNTISSYDTNGVATDNGGAGQISSTTPSSSPRQIQLALKFLF
jgi:hypothetical protein